MVKTLLLFRTKQFARLLKSIGWGLLLIAVPLVFVMVMVILDLIRKSEPLLSAAVILILLLSLHLNRKDAQWLTHISRNPTRLFLVEYTGLLLPLSLAVFMLFGNWLIPVLVHSGAILISFLPALNKSKSRILTLNLSWIPVEAFEYRSGIRKYFWLLIPLYFFGLLISKFVFGALLITLLFGLSVTAFYDESEPKELIETIQLSKLGGNLKLPPNLIRRKTWLHSLVFHAFLSPHYALFLIFHTKYWWILLTAALIAESLLLFALVYKYAHWLPGKRRVYNSTALSLYSLGFLVPFFFPASVGSLISMWRKALKRIRYFYAEN